MKNIERVLEEIIIADVEPDDEIVRKTNTECRKIEREVRQAKIDIRMKKARLTVRLLAAASFVAFVFFALIIAAIGNQNPMKGSAYYTIDINPSFGFSVDENNIVMEVTFQNNDAKELYEGLDCVGLSFLEAVKLVVDKAKANGYLEEEGTTYVLLGQFLSNSSEEDGEEMLRNLLAGLQSELGDNVQMIGVSGDEDDLEQAMKLEVSPGILILCNLSDGVTPDSDLKVEDVVDYAKDYISAPQFAAPVIEGREDGSKVIISLSEIDFSKITDRNTEVEYKLIRGKTLDEIKEKKNIIATSKAGVSDEQPTEFSIDITAAELNKKIYYCVYVTCDNTSKFSNVLPITIKGTETNATHEPTKEPEIIPEATGAEGASIISGGSISDGKITFNWTGIDSTRFDGYKVMYSYTDSTPVYGENECYYLEYVTDASKTTGTYKLTSLAGYKEGRKFYFSITALYDGQQTKVAGNVISKVMPVNTAVTATPDPANDYASTTIRGEMDGNKIYLNWNKISDDRFEGYKVVYSFTDSTPAYDSSPYLRWITDASITSTIISLSELAASTETRTCYFSVTALYNDHSVMIPGNAISFSIPPSVTEPYIAPNLNYAFCSEEDGKINMNWSAVDHSEFQYYKANFSFSNTSPSYGAAGTQSFMTSSTYFSISAAELSGFEEGATVYMSVTAVYTGGNKTSNVISDVVCSAPVTEPLISPDPITVYSSQTDGNIYINWSGEAASHSKFSYFKIVYQIDGVTRTINVGAAVAWSKLAANLEGYVEGTTTSGIFSVAAVYTTGETKTSGSQSVPLYAPPA